MAAKKKTAPKKAAKAPDAKALVADLKRNG